MSRAATPLFEARPGEGFETGSSRARLVNQVEADQLIRTGTTVALAALWIPLADAAGGGRAG